MNIELPSTLTAELYREWSDENSGYVYFIKLKFGTHIIETWEWQAELPLNCRWEPSESDIDEFIAGKIRELLLRALNS